MFFSENKNDAVKIIIPSNIANHIAVAIKSFNPTIHTICKGIPDH